MLEFINKKENVLDECIRGIMAAQPGEFIRIENPYSYSFYRKAPEPKRVQIVISGGGGRGPMFPGFVGEGLADGVSHGDFDCAPTAYAIYETAKAVDAGRGVLLLTNHFTGDYLNNDMAKEFLENEGIRVMICYASDDLFSARGEPKEHRGGLSGIGLLIKIAACAARQGLPLEKVFRITEKANDRLRSVTVCLNPETGEMEFGNGFSGEQPYITHPFKSADDMAEKVLKYFYKELRDVMNGTIHLMVNRMYEMTYVEGCVVTESLRRRLAADGYPNCRCAVGSYFDAFDANGCIISILAADEELDTYLKPVHGYDFTI